MNNLINPNLTNNLNTRISDEQLDGLEYYASIR